MPAQRRAQPGQGLRVFCAVHFTLEAASTVLPSVANSGSFLSCSTECFCFAFSLAAGLLLMLPLTFLSVAAPGPCSVQRAQQDAHLLHALREHWFLRAGGGNTNGCGHAFASLARQGDGGR